MSDKGIIFSAPMVRALLDGRKSQTRRVLKEDKCGAPILPYLPGDLLYVREAAAWVSGWGWRYRADDDDLTEKRQAGEVGKWRPSIHMPRTASRLTLIVTDVRVQRLQEIDATDARAEGMSREYGRMSADAPQMQTNNEVQDFAILWNSLHGPEAWDENPWVVAITFETHRRNIDQMARAA